MITFNPLLNTGCVGGPEYVDAGCVGPTGEESQAAEPPPAASESTGRAAPAPVEASDPKAMPPQTMREFERALRELGFTRLQAEHIAAKGFASRENASAAEADQHQQTAGLLEALKRRGLAITKGLTT